MDPLTAFLIVALMMLLNGGVLGLMHRDLPQDVRPSALSWRVGILLQAYGCILFALQTFLRPAFGIPMANGLILLGTAGCWRAMRQFYGQRETVLLLLPVVLGTVGVAWFAGPQPSLVARVVVASLALAVMLVGSAWTILAATRRAPVLSARVLAGIFGALAVFMLLRVGYFMLSPRAASSVMDARSWMNAITPMLASVLPVIGTTGFLLLCADRIRRQWERAASTDYLTGLANRRTLAADGARWLQQTTRDGRTLAVALLDIDHFKTINDRFGHDAGDLALIHVTQRLRAVCDDGYLLARQGGEEFVAVLALDGDAQALVVAEQLREAVRGQPFHHGEETLTITVSIGLAVRRDTDRSLDDLLRRADAALYRAKRGGRDRVESAEA
jgi:diguanylate cyclase (GGDEF)-like protein